MANHEHIYEGASYALDQDYGNFIGYRLKSGVIGTSLRPDTAAQIVEASNILNQGFKSIEVGAISQDIFNTIPKDHFKEIARLSKLTGSQVSLHAPIQGIEASGIVEGNFSENNRIVVERQLKDVIDKASQMDPEGNIPVTIHSANMAGTSFVRGDTSKGEAKFKTQQLIAIDQETGQAQTQFQEDVHYSISKDPRSKQAIKKEIWTPEDRLKNANEVRWDNKINELANFKKSTDEIIDRTLPHISDVIAEEAQGKAFKNGKFSNEQQAAFGQLNKMTVFLQNARQNFGSMLNESYKYADKKSRKKLDRLANDWRKGLNEIGKYENKNPTKPISHHVNQIEVMSKLLDLSIQSFGNINAPKIIIPVEEFAMEKSSKTFANVALHSYKKYGDKAPIIGIENLYPGLAFSKPADFKKLIDTTREKFIDKAKKQGYSNSEAKEAANQVIGVTWDVGHLNMLRKQGFKEKDLIEATKLLAKDVKHVHLTDNFGYGDSHLAPGMGNVPIKKHLEALEKAGALDNSRIINEIGGFVNQFKTSPFPYMLESFGAHTGVEGVPYWNQAVWNSGNYYSGQGTINPDVHHSIYGRGFANLPQELGGQVPGANSSRATGTPLA